MKFLFVTLCAGLCFAGNSPAQQTTPLPTGPLIARRAPDFSEWVQTTTIKNPALRADAKGKANVQTMKVTKTGDIRHVITLTSDGVRSEVWCKGVTQIVFRPEWKEPLLSTGENTWDPARIDFSGSDFAGFTWLTAANFVDVRKVSGRDCLVFQDKILPFQFDPKDKPINEDGTPAKPVDLEKLKVAAVACVDLESRLPVTLQVGGALTSFQFNDPPAALQTLPPQALKALNMWDQKLQTMLRKPARP